MTFSWSFYLQKSAQTANNCTADPGKSSGQNMQQSTYAFTVMTITEGILSPVFKKTLAFEKD
jgi:hypothetical protein